MIVCPGLGRFQDHVGWTDPRTLEGALTAPRGKPENFEEYSYVVAVTPLCKCSVDVIRWGHRMCSRLPLYPTLPSECPFLYCARARTRSASAWSICFLLPTSFHFWCFSWSCVDVPLIFSPIYQTTCRTGNRVYYWIWSRPDRFLLTQKHPPKSRLPRHQRENLGERFVSHDRYRTVTRRFTWRLYCHRGRDRSEGGVFDNAADHC